MEGLTRLVSESLARHGFDRPLDYRRLRWSRWFRCESPHSLLQVPSKPGVFALAEELLDFGASSNHGAADALARRAERSSAIPPAELEVTANMNREGHDFSRADEAPAKMPALAAEEGCDGNHPEAEPRRLLAVVQFFEDEDMAFILDRMLSHQNPMRARLNSGRYFVRFVVIEDEFQRRSISNALNQWIANSAEKATGIGSHFATSLELTRDSVPGEENAAGERPLNGGSPVPAAAVDISIVRAHQFAQLRSTAAETSRAELSSNASPQPASGAVSNIQCPFPSGF